MEIKEVFEDFTDSFKKGGNGKLIVGLVFVGLFIVVYLTQSKKNTSTETVQISGAYASYPDAVTNADTIISTVQNNIDYATQELKETLALNNQDLLNTTGSGFDALTSGIDSLSGGIGSLTDSINLGFADMTQQYSQSMEKLDSISGSVASGFESISGTVTSGFQNISSQYAQGLEKADALADKIGMFEEQMTVELESLGTSVNAIKNKVPSYVPVPYVDNSAIDSLKEEVTNLKEQLTETKTVPVERIEPDGTVVHINNGAVNPVKETKPDGTVILYDTITDYRKV